MKQNKIFVLRPYLFVAARNGRAAKQIAAAQLERLADHAISDSTWNEDDIVGIAGVQFGNVSPNPIKFEKDLRETWGLVYPLNEDPNPDRR